MCSAREEHRSASIWSGRGPMLCSCTPESQTRGCGPAPSVPFRPLDDVVAVLDNLAVDRFSVIGCSMGGTLAVDLAVRYPNRVQALVPVAAGVSGLPESNDALEPEYGQLEAAVISGDLERFGQIALAVS